MRPLLSLPWCLALCASAALAQPPAPPPSRATAAPDTTFTLAGARQLWGHVGVGWPGTPEEVRHRYNPGLDVAVSADRRFAGSFAARARLELHMLPSSSAAFTNDLGNVDVVGSQKAGYLGTLEAGAAMSPWNHVWIEAAGGGGYLASGMQNAQLVDPVTQQPYPLAGTSGWGLLWSVATRYEFQPAPRKRLLAEVRYVSLDRPRARLGFWHIGMGYSLR